MNEIDKLLARLHIQADNSGASASIGSEQAWWSAAHSSAPKIASINPATEVCLAKVSSASKEDYEHVIEQAQKAANEWRMQPAPKRGDLVRQLGDLFRQYKEPLGRLVAAESGKLLEEGCGEIQEVIDMADLAVGQSRMLYGKMMHSERPHHRMYEQWHPLGVVGVITAFNFPAAVWAWNAFIAAIAGNTVVWKPSPKTPLTAIAIQHLCNQVMQSNGLGGVFNLFITDDNSLAENFVSDTRLPLISFTGSSIVGRKVNEIVAHRFGRSLLELSGNNAIIVTESATLKLVLPAILFGAIGTTGQRCTSTRRVFIHESIYQKVVDALVSAYKTIKVGDPLMLSASDLSMGPLIDEQAVKAFVKTIDALNALNAELLCGGKVLTGKGGYFVEPTLVKAEAHWEPLQRETFAPILYLIPYKELDEAIVWQNSVPQGLSSAIFTNEICEAEKFLSAMGSDCGIANVNLGTSGAEIGGAFGGEKETGGGREAGSDAWKAYMRRQTTTINWGKQMPLAQAIQFNYPETP